MIWPGSALPRKIAQDLRASYWLVPAMMVMVALLVAIAAEVIDRHGLATWIPHLFYGTNVDSSRAVLSVIAPSALGAAGVMFSMTIVAVSFASTNFGPRLIGNFMQDRGVQISLGSLLATFIYALMVLRGLRTGADGFDYVPAISMTLALIMSVWSVMVMIYFVHHIPELISLENVTASLGRTLLRAIDDLPRSTIPTEPNPPEEARAQLICQTTTGYVQAVNTDTLSSVAQRPGWVLEVCARPGYFVAPHHHLARVWAPEPISDTDRRAIAGCFAIGPGRTEAQNPLFIALELTEIIARALSPGVNDPFTARTCLNWLHAALHRIAAKGPVDPDRIDGVAQVAALGFLDVLQAAHGMTRQYIAADAMVTVHAYGLLAHLEDTLPQGPRREKVRFQRIELAKEAKARCPHSTPVADLSSE